MRRIAFVPFALAALLIMASPVPASAHSYAFGQDHGPGKDDDFGWAVVSDDHSQMSEVDDAELLDELKDRYDGDFLYIRDGKDQYVIRDQRLVERGQATTSEISKYGKEIGKLARARAKLALSRVGLSSQRRSLERAQRDLEREIARNERLGEPTEGLERALRKIREEIGALPDEDRDAGLSASEREDLERQSDDARKHLQDAVSKIRREMRDILREAKARGKVEKLDAKSWKSY